MSSASPVDPSAELSLLSPEFLARLEQLELVTRKIFRGRMKGERRSKRKGQSVEFADFRNYVAGDDLRFIDWNTYARLDRMFLKMFLEEEDLHFYMLLDTSASMDFGAPSKLDYAKRVAAALGFIGLTHSDRIRVETFSQPAGQRGPVWRGRASLWRLLDYLNKLEPGGATDLATGVRNFCLRNPGKGILVIVSDLLDKAGYERALRLLVAQQMDVYVIQILAAEELKPDLKGDLQLVDSEDDDRAELTISAPLLKRYEQTLAAFVAGVRDYCTRRGMTHLLASTEQPFEQLITGYLRQRGLVR
ncbi:MAG: DUF58 domain-containing protein [Pirellulales bacterium]|nr:DUF58 domain-containing protein [Pirellulales bacterium]